MVNISMNLVDKALREAGAKRISKKAKKELKQFIEKEIEKISREAVGIAKREKTKTILDRHIKEAIQQKTLI